MKKDNKENKLPSTTDVYVPEMSETKALTRVLKDFERGKTVINKSYNQFNGRNLYDAIDDWTKRWNGYISAPNPILNQTQSHIFVNFTRNAIISYLSKIAMVMPKPKIIAVNKKSNLENKKFAEILSDLNQYSSYEEQGESRFLESALEVTTKGTVIIYEGYSKNEQDMEIPEDFDAETGKIKTKKKKRILFDNCYQQIVPIEDFYITNPYEPNIQKQPCVIWRRITTLNEAKQELGHYKNFEYVKGGQWSIIPEPTTFYRNAIQTELGKDQVEILKYYNRSENKHIIIVNGVVIYDGILPFKDGKYPFAKGIYEPYGNDFFWGAGFPQKIMGDQDLLNTFWNMMVDKTYGSLLPFGLSSDLDDIVEDEVLAVNKIRKVNDINKWKFETLPGVDNGEINMLQTALRFAQDNSGITMGGAQQATAKGKMTARQILTQQQEAMSRIGFTLNFLEDLERDRTELRIHHILQFYSIPKIEKITGKRGKEIEQLTYRDIKLQNVDLSSGKKGNKIIKLVDDLNSDKRKVLENELSVIETKGELSGVPTEALAISVDSFYDYDFKVQIVKNSSYERNAALDQASRMEFVSWRTNMIPLGAPADVPEMVKWVEESFDIDSERFEAQPDQQQVQQPGQPIQPRQQPLAPQLPQGRAPLSELNRTKPTTLSSL